MTFIVKQLTRTRYTSRVTETLFQAFADDPVMDWILGRKKQYNKKAYRMIYYCVRYAIIYGLVFTTKDYKSVAIREVKQIIRPRFFVLLRSGLIFCRSFLAKTHSNVFLLS